MATSKKANDSSIVPLPADLAGKALVFDPDDGKFYNADVYTAQEKAKLAAVSLLGINPNQLQFDATNNWYNIVGMGGSSNITPAAPTNGVVDDTADTFNWTHPASYTTADEETTVDGGVTATAAVKPLSVGNANKSAGQVGVRVKAAAGRDPSQWLFNASAFNASGGGGGSTLSTLSTLTIIEQKANGGLTADSGDANSYTATTGATWCRFGQHAPANADGIIYQELDANSFGVVVALDLDDTLENYFTSQYNYTYYYKNYTDQYGSEVRYGSGQNGFTPNTSIPVGSVGTLNGIGRIGTSIVLVSSTNGGSSYTITYTFPGTAPTGILYFKAAFDTVGQKLVHPKGYNVV